MPSTNRSAADELRLIVKALDSTNENFNDRWTVDELVRIYQAHLQSGWDFAPDRWESRQIQEALAGRAPTWDDREEPTYADGGEATVEP